MERYVIWFLPVNKKIQINQFHTAADSIEEALNNLKREADFAYKVMGVGNFREDKEKNQFVNNKFY